MAKRKQNDKRWQHGAPPPEQVPLLMRELVEWLRADTGIHSVLVAGIAQFQLVHIHPFVDGNGRTSRLLSTLCLYRSGYDFKRLFTLSEFYDRDRGAFYAAIQGVRQRGMEMTAWLEYFVDGLATQMGEVKRRGELAIRRDVIAREHGLNERQAQAVEALLEQRPARNRGVRGARPWRPPAHPPARSPGPDRTGCGGFEGGRPICPLLPERQALMKYRDRIATRIATNARHLLRRAVRRPAA